MEPGRPGLGLNKVSIRLARPAHRLLPPPSPCLMSKKGAHALAHVGCVLRLPDGSGSRAKRREAPLRARSPPGRPWAAEQLNFTRAARRALQSKVTGRSRQTHPVMVLHPPSPQGAGAWLRRWVTPASTPSWPGRSPVLRLSRASHLGRGWSLRAGAWLRAGSSEAPTGVLPPTAQSDPATQAPAPASVSPQGPVTPGQSCCSSDERPALARRDSQSRQDAAPWLPNLSPLCPVSQHQSTGSRPSWTGHGDGPLPAEASVCLLP